MIKSLKNLKNSLVHNRDYRIFISDLRIERLTQRDFINPEIKREVFNTYRDIFGHGGSEWGEYVKCSKCEMVYDIEKTHRVDRYIHISDLPKELPLSSCCSFPVNYFHTEEMLNKRFDLLFKKENSIFLVLKDKKLNKIVGLIIGYIDNFSIIWRENIEGKLNLSSDFVLDPALLKKTFLYIDELGIIYPYRKGKVPLFSLLHNLLDICKSHEDLYEILFWTSKKSKLFKLIQQLDYNILIEDLMIPPQIVATVPFESTRKRVRFVNLVYN